MIKALNIASQGMQQAERRATDIAADILKSTSELSSFSLEDTPSQQNGTGSKQNTAAPVASPSGPGYGELLQHMVDLKAEEQAFKANATLFKRIDEAEDDALGALFDEDS